MATTPPQNEWPTQVREAPTAIIEDGVAPDGGPVPPPEDPRRRAVDDMWLWLLGLALLVVAGVVALWWFQFHDSDSTSTQPTVTVTTAAAPVKIATPRLIGLQQSAAAAKVTQAGLKPLPKPVKSLTAARGTVIAQTPAPGTPLARGSEVTLDVSAGKPAVAVPDVTGRLASDGVTALHDAGFKTLVASVPSSQPKGTIVAEAPSAGTKAPSGSTIRLNVSKGRAKPSGGTSTAPAPGAPAQTRTTPTVPTTTSTPTSTAPAPRPSTVAVPDVTTQAIFPAVRSLERSELHSEVTLVQSSQPAGRVISQSPTAQSKVNKGQVVTLNVSLGPDPAPMTEVPDVTGMDVQQATQMLTDAGFTVQSVDRKVAGAAQDAKVVDEQPFGQAPQGFTIVLVVGRLTG